MEKEALINIIISDLKEVQQLIETFKGKSAINGAFIKLAKSKIGNINEELFLLEQLSGGEPVKETTIESMQVDTFTEPVQKQINPMIQEEPVDTDSEIASKNTDELVDNQAVNNNPQSISSSVLENEKTKTERKENKDATILADVLNKESKSVNEEISKNKDTKVERVQQLGKPVDDVRKALGVNDRFYFQRELFGGNAELFNNTLDQINQMSCFEDANNFLASNFGWEHDSEVANSFIKIVKRRFI